MIACTVEVRVVNHNKLFSDIHEYTVTNHYIFYIFSEFGWKDTVADKISTFYDIGGIVGNDIK